MSAPVLYPPARYRPVRNRSGTMVRPTRGLIPHVQVGRGSLYGWFDNAASKVSSHLWLSRSGEFEQYVPFDQKAWCQGAGNPYWISCECEGFPSEDYTPIQVTRLAELYAWGVREFGWRLEITDSPDGYGLGTHRMGGAAWGGHACPGDIRADRRGDILAAARRILHPTPPAAPAAPEVDDMPSPSQWTADDWKAFAKNVGPAVADHLAGQMRQLVTADPDSNAPVKMADTRIGTVGDALGLLVLRSSFGMRRDGQLATDVHAALAETAALRAAMSTMVDPSHPAADILSAPAPALATAGPLTLDDLLAALPGLDAAAAVRLAHAAAGHAAGLLTPPA